MAIVVAYGLILPKAILEAPKFGCLNIHASLLPRWRGASPIQHSIWKGDDETGITIMQMDEGLDTGPMIEKETIQITEQTTAQLLHDDLSVLGSQMIVEVVNRLAQNGGLKSEIQDDSYSTYAPMLKKQDGVIDWNQSANEVDQQIRALNPWPGVYTTTDEGKRIKVLEARITEHRKSDAVGALLDRGQVACGSESTLELVKIQPDNAKPMDVVSAINGGYLKPGKAFT